MSPTAPTSRGSTSATWFSRVATPARSAPATIAASEPRRGTVSAKPAAVGAQIVALSADAEQDTAGLIEQHDLTFPGGDGADARHLAQLTGACLNDDPRYVQSTGFVLDAHRRVIVSVYSSEAIGRLVPDDVVGLIRSFSATRRWTPRERRALPIPEVSHGHGTRRLRRQRDLSSTEVRSTHRSSEPCANRPLLELPERPLQ